MPVDRRQREDREDRETDALAWAKSAGTFTPTAIKPPEGVKVITPNSLKPGTYRYDVVPYKVGKGNPRADQGFLHFEREWTQHFVPSPGGKGKPYCCLWNTFGKKCPVCDWLDANANREPDLARQMGPRLRHLFNIVDLDNRKAGIQIFDANHYNKKRGFGEQLVAAITSRPKYANFAKLKGGYTLILTVDEDTMGEGKKYNLVTRIDFEEREKNYPPDFWKKAHCLDSLLVEASYKELKAALLSGGTEEEETNHGSQEDEKEQEVPELKVGMRVDHAEFGECEVVHVSPDGSKVKLKDEDGDRHVGCKPEDCRVLEQEDDDDDDLGDDEQGEDGDEDEGDEGDSEDSDEEEESEDDEGDEDEDFAEEDSLEKGDTVSFTYKKKERTGKVVKLDAKNKLAQVKCDDQERPYAVSFDALEKVTTTEDDDDDWEEDDEEEPEEKPKKRGKK